MNSRFPTEADAVIVGAGITGCSTAYRLAKHGWRVVVLEKDDIAHEASGRTMAAVGLVGKHHPDEFALIKASMEIWFGLNDELGTDIEFINGGRLVIANTEEDMPLFEEMISGAEESGVEVQWYDAPQARTKWPFLQGPFIKAAWSQHEGHVNPVKVVNSFARSAREYGAQIVTGCLATEVVTRAGRVTSVITNRGEISTPVVLDAAGVWGYRLADRLGVKLPIQLIKVVQGETEPAPRLFDCFLRGPTYGSRQTASGAFRVTGGYRKMDVYHDLSLHDLRDMATWIPRLLRYRGDVSMKLNKDILKLDFAALVRKVTGTGNGAPAPVGTEPRPQPENVARKLKRVGQLVPEMKGLRLTKTWGGYVDMTPDFLPIIGPVNGIEGFYLATGFSGHGFAAGPIVGKLMADLIIDGRTSVDINSFRPSRFAEEKTPVPPRLM